MDSPASLDHLSHPRPLGRAPLSFDLGGHIQFPQSPPRLLCMGRCPGYMLIVGSFLLEVRFEELSVIRSVKKHAELWERPPPMFSSVHWNKFYLAGGFCLKYFEYLTELDKLAA